MSKTNTRDGKRFKQQRHVATPASADNVISGPASHATPNEAPGNNGSAHTRAYGQGARTGGAGGSGNGTRSGGPGGPGNGALSGTAKRTGQGNRTLSGGPNG